MSRSRRPSWVDVTVGDKTVGYVYPMDGRWVAVMEADGHTGKTLGSAEDKTAAVRLVVAAYLRT